MGIAAMWILAIAVLVAGILMGIGLLQLAAAHADLERACLQGGGTEYQAPIDAAAGSDPGSEPVGTCYQPE